MILDPTPEFPSAGFGVVLPAGGRISGAFAAAAGTEFKALLPLEGKTILRRMVETLRATGRVNSIAVVGPDEVLQEARGCGVEGTLSEGASGPENILAGLEWMIRQKSETPRVLILTTDLPFLTTSGLTIFLDRCPSRAAIAVPAITQKAFEGRFPASSNTFVRLRGGAFTLGCAFVVDPMVLLHNRERLESIFLARKSQITMARLLGGVFVARFLTRQLAVEHIEQRCGQILGCSGAAVLNCAPELAFDIDLPEEYQYAIAHASAILASP